MERGRGAYNVYHWDTFDNETFLLAECSSIEEAVRFVHDRYDTRISHEGADRVDIVCGGEIIRQYKVR